MSTSKNKKNVYVIFTNDCMTQKILDSIGINSTRMLYDHFQLKLNLRQLFIFKWDVLYLIIN